MRDQVPPELGRLLAATDPDARERAWQALLAAYSPLLLSVSHARAKDRDAAMDAYTFILEQLREQDFRRLRVWVADGRSRFSTWLVVVARRLCLDHHRRRYGRIRAPAEQAPAVRADRRARFQLADLAGESIDITAVAADAATGTDVRLRRTELRAALRSELAQLDERDRLLLVHRFRDDVPVRESAQLLGFPTPFHVYRALRRILDGMRGRLEQRGVLDPLP